jgi:hypothetical protein
MMEQFTQKFAFRNRNLRYREQVINLIDFSLAFQLRLYRRRQHAWHEYGCAMPVFSFGFGERFLGLAQPRLRASAIRAAFDFNHTKQCTIRCAKLNIRLAAKLNGNTTLQNEFAVSNRSNSLRRYREFLCFDVLDNDRLNGERRCLSDSIYPCALA